MEHTSNAAGPSGKRKQGGGKSQKKKKNPKGRKTTKKRKVALRKMSKAHRLRTNRMTSANKGEKIDHEFILVDSPEPSNTITYSDNEPFEVLEFPELGVDGKEPMKVFPGHLDGSSIVMKSTHVNINETLRNWFRWQGHGVLSVDKTIVRMHGVSKNMQAALLRPEGEDLLSTRSLERALSDLIILGNCKVKRIHHEDRQFPDKVDDGVLPDKSEHAVHKDDLGPFAQFITALFSQVDVNVNTVDITISKADDDSFQQTED